MTQTRRPLFVYGSMLDPDVAEVVLGRPLRPGDMAPAWMQGCRAVRVPDENYPVLVSAPGEWLRGALIHDITEEELDRVRYFESYEYELQTCTVSVPGRGPVEAIYCGAAQVDADLDHPWDLEAWRAAHKDEFLDITRRFMRLYGRAPIEEADELWEELMRNTRRPKAQVS